MPVLDTKELKLDQSDISNLHTSIRIIATYVALPCLWILPKTFLCAPLKIQELFFTWGSLTHKQLEAQVNS